MTSSADQFSSRREKLAAGLKRRGLDAMLVTDPVNVGYLTGFSGEDSHLVVRGAGSLVLSDRRFTEQLAEECPGLDVYLRKPGELLSAAQAKALRRLTNVGFEASSLSYGDWETLKSHCPTVVLAPLHGVIEGLRVIKDSDEIRQIREAIAIAEKAFEGFREAIRPESTEKELADEMESLVRRAGGTRSAFPAIVAAGPRAALPHAPPTNEPIGEPELLLVDWGAKGKFYHSDLTRVLSGRKLSRKFRRLYEVVLEAQRRAIALIRPGVTGEAVDAAARDVIAQAGLGRAFSHSLGHGLGMAVHEAPGLRRGSTIELKAGMIVTVEPGVYFRGWGGIRLEDDILVTRDGREVLTSVSKSLEESLLFD